MGAHRDVCGRHAQNVACCRSLALGAALILLMHTLLQQQPPLQQQQLARCVCSLSLLLQPASLLKVCGFLWPRHCACIFSLSLMISRRDVKALHELVCSFNCLLPSIVQQCTHVIDNDTWLYLWLWFKATAVVATDADCATHVK